PGDSHKYVHAKFGLAMDGIRVADPRTQLSHPGHRGAKVIFNPGRDEHAEFVRTAHVRPRTRRPNDPFRRHAADVEAIASHQVFLDQGHFSATRRRDHRRDQAGRAGPDHHDVVRAGRIRVHPVRWAHIADQLLIVLVVRKHDHWLMVGPGLVDCGREHHVSSSLLRRLTATRSYWRFSGTK